MFNNRKDDDVIVISEEDVTYENADENGAPADSAPAPAGGDAAVSDQHDRTVPTGTGRLSAVATPGEDAADEATDDGPPYGTSSPYGTSADVPASSGPDTTDAAERADAVTDADDADEADGTVNGTGTGSAIPMPAATASPATPADPVATPAAAPATPAAAAATSTDATAAPVAGPAAPVVDVDSNWPQIQALFVDDPQSAVRQAADVAGGAVAALVAAAKNREQTMRDAWQSDSTGTEDLRTALRGYRDLASRLSALAREL